MSSINEHVFNATNNLLPNIDSPHTNFFNKQITSRVCHLLAIPVEIITRLVDAILGVGGLIAVLFTWGKFDNINQFAFIHLSSAEMLVPSIIKHTLSFINPSTEMREVPILNPNDLSALLGITTSAFIETMSKSIHNCKSSYDPFVKNVLGRLVGLLTTVGSIVTKVIDIALACIASIGSLITLGMWTECNNFIFKQFKTVYPVLIVSTLFQLTVINP